MGGVSRFAAPANCAISAVSMGWFRGWQWRKQQTLADDEDFLLVTWDSCRYDAYGAARAPALDACAAARSAWAMATYTLRRLPVKSRAPNISTPAPVSCSTSFVGAGGQLRSWCAATTANVFSARTACVVTPSTTSA
jgi:hypothetical protein